MDKNSACDEIIATELDTENSSSGVLNDVQVHHCGSDLLIKLDPYTGVFKFVCSRRTLEALGCVKHEIGLRRHLKLRLFI